MAGLRDRGGWLSVCLVAVEVVIGVRVSGPSLLRCYGGAEFYAPCWGFRVVC